MHRRSLVLTTASLVASPAVVRADTLEGRGDLDMALRRFMALPGAKSYLVHAGRNGAAGRIEHEPDRTLFIASAFKTFVLGQYLRDVEAGRLSRDEELAIDDEVRTLGGPVFINLAGTTDARAVLEAMITRSDNIATDLATLKVGVNRVRALIAEAGLSSIRIPDSSRLFLSYIVGAPLGVDIGWAGVQRLIAEGLPDQVLPLVNDEQTILGNARDLVSWYEQALRGSFFKRPETLREFKRIQALSEQIALAVAPDTAAYAKGGEVPSFNGFNAKSFAGQMVVDERTPVTFCFLLNWEAPLSEFARVEAAYFAAIAGILRQVKRALS